MDRYTYRGNSFMPLPQFSIPSVGVTVVPKCAKKNYSLTVDIGNRVKFSKHGEGDLKLIIGRNVRIEDDVRIAVSGTVVLEDNVTLHNHVSILGPGDCTIGKGTWIGQYTMLDATGGLEIGKDCCIGFNCQIWSHVRRVPQLPKIRFDKFAKTVLKDSVWLQGGMTTVSPGVTLGKGCVVFSNSVVTRDTKPKRVYGGVPVRIIKKYPSPYTLGREQ